MNTKLNELEDEKIIEETLKSANELIYKASTLSIFGVMKASKNLKENIKENDLVIKNLGRERKNIEKLFKKVFDRSRYIDVMITEKHIDDSLSIEYFKKLRKEIYKYMMSLSGYITELSYSNEINKEIVNKREMYKEYSNYGSIDLNSFYNDVYAFLREDTRLVSDKISKIVSILPMKMSRNKYYEIVKMTLNKSLDRYSKTRAEKILDRYKGYFNGTLDPEYGQRFDKYFIASQMNRNTPAKDEKDEVIYKNIKDTALVMDEIQKVIELLIDAGIIVNQLIALSMMRDVIVENTDKHIKKIADKIHKEIVKDKENYEESVLKNFRNYIMEVEDSFKETNEMFYAQVGNYIRRKLKNEELEKNIKKIQNVFIYMNDYKLENEELMIFEEEKVMDKKLKKQLIDNFTDFIDRNVRNMDGTSRKIRMRRLLSQIEFAILGPEEFFNYLKNALENNTEMREKKAIVENINAFMGMYK